MQRNLKTWMTRTALPLVLFLAGIGLGRMFPDTALPQTQAQIDEPRRRKAFKAGGERATIVLQEISNRLKTMDSRVANIETMLKNHRGGK